MNFKILGVLCGVFFGIYAMEQDDQDFDDTYYPPRMLSPQEKKAKEVRDAYEEARMRITQLYLFLDVRTYYLQIGKKALVDLDILDNAEKSKHNPQFVRLKETIESSSQMRKIFQVLSRSYRERLEQLKKVYAVSMPEDDERLIQQAHEKIPKLMNAPSSPRAKTVVLKRSFSLPSAPESPPISPSDSPLQILKRKLKRLRISDSILGRKHDINDNDT